MRLPGGNAKTMPAIVPDRGESSACMKRGNQPSCRSRSAETATGARIAELERSAAGAADPGQEDRRSLGPLLERILPIRRARHQIAALVLAEEERGRIASGGAFTVAPMPEAIAISASATASPPSERSCTAVDETVRDQRADEVADALFMRRDRPAAAAPSSRPRISRR